MLFEILLLAAVEIIALIDALVGKQIIASLKLSAEEPIFKYRWYTDIFPNVQLYFTKFRTIL